MSHQLHRLTLSKTVKKQGEDLKNNEGEWTGKEHVWKRVQNVEIGTIHKKKNTHIHSHIYSLSLSHTHTHTKRMQDYSRSRGGLSFLCFLHVLGPQRAECCLQVVDIHTLSYLRHRGQVFADSVLGSRNPQVHFLYLFPQICPPDPTSFEQ